MYPEVCRGCGGLSLGHEGSRSNGRRADRADGPDSAGCETHRDSAGLARDSSQGCHLRLPHGSGSTPGGPGKLPEMRHGAGTGNHHRRRGGRHLRARRHDAPFLGEPGIDGAAASSRHGADGGTSDGVFPRRGIAASGTVAGDTSRAVGRGVILSAWLVFHRQPQSQHVYADCTRRWRGLRLQPGRRTCTRHFSRGTARDGRTS